MLDQARGGRGGADEKEVETERFRPCSFANLRAYRDALCIFGRTWSEFFRCFAAGTGYQDDIQPCDCAGACELCFESTDTGSSCIGLSTYRQRHTADGED